MHEHENKHETTDRELDVMLAQALGPHDDDAPPPDLSQRIIAATVSRVTVRRQPVLARLGGKRMWAGAAMAAACVLAVGVLWQLGEPQPTTMIEPPVAARADDAWPTRLDQTLTAITSERVDAGGIDAELAMLAYDVDQLHQIDSDTSLADAAAALDELLRQWEHHADDEQVGLF